MLLAESMTWPDVAVVSVFCAAMVATVWIVNR